jgi:hypothetical protein
VEGTYLEQPCWRNRSSRDGPWNGPLRSGFLRNPICRATTQWGKCTGRFCWNASLGVDGSRASPSLRMSDVFRCNANPSNRQPMFARCRTPNLLANSRNRSRLADKKRPTHVFSCNLFRRALRQDLKLNRNTNAICCACPLLLFISLQQNSVHCKYQTAPEER